MGLKNIIGALCTLVVAGTAGAMAVPKSREYLSDLIAEKLSPKYETVLNENNSQKSTIEELNKKISIKDEEITTKTNLIAEKDKTITNLNNELSESVEFINTLSTQKTALLSVVTEIDNKINSTTDATEIDNLEERKASILAQIDILNEEIETLEQEKSQLEADIAVLQQEKATLEEEIEKLKQEKAELEKQVQDLEQQIEELEKQKGVKQVASFNGFDAVFGVTYTKLTLNNSLEDYLNNGHYVVNVNGSGFYLGNDFKIGADLKSIRFNQVFENRWDIYSIDFDNIHTHYTQETKGKQFYNYNYIINGESCSDASSLGDDNYYFCYVANVNENEITFAIDELNFVYKIGDNFIDFANKKLKIDSNEGDLIIKGGSLSGLIITCNNISYTIKIENYNSISLNGVPFSKVNSVDDDFDYSYEYVLSDDCCFTFFEEITDLKFLSNGQIFNSVTGDGVSLYYDDLLVCENGSWVNDSFKTITFDEYPSLELRDSLLLNATLTLKSK